MTELLRKDAKNQQLFYTPLGAADFQKLAQEIELSQDVREWPAIILQEFASEHPYAFQSTAPEIEFEKIDEKTGNAFGAIILRKPYQVTGVGNQERLESEPEKIAVPIVVEDFQLKPFEVFIRGAVIMPLTETRFAEATSGAPVATGLDPMFQPSPVFLDKMIPPTSGYLGNMYGNYSLFSGEEGYGNQTPIKGAAEKFDPKLEKVGGSSDPMKDSTFLGSIRNTLQPHHHESFRGSLSDERVVSGFAMNKTLNIVRDILGTSPTSFDDYCDFLEKAAPVHLVKLDRLSSGRWRATYVNDYFYKPVTCEMSAAEVVKNYSSIEPSIASLMQKSEQILIESPKRIHNKAVILEDHDIVAEEVEADGHFMCVTKGGGCIEGQVFTSVKDYNGNPFPAKLFLGGNAYNLQEELVGQKMGDVFEGLRSGSVEHGIEGTFVGQDEKGQFALLPFKVLNVGFMNGLMVVSALGVAQEQLTFVFMPGVANFVNATGIADPLLGGQVAGNVMYVPPSFHFIATGKHVGLQSDPRQVKDLLSKKVFFSPDRNPVPFDVETSRKGHSRSLRVIKGWDGTFTLKGAILETMKRDDELQDLSAHDAHFILACLGLSLDEAARVTAQAGAKGEINVSNLRPAKDIVVKNEIGNQQLRDIAAIFRRNLVKEASVISGCKEASEFFKTSSTIGDPQAVDAMLSLNFVNEANLTQFLNNMPLFRKVEEKLAELYLYSVLGLKNEMPEQSVLSAMKSLNEVNENLEYFAAMLRTPASQAAPQPVIG